MKSEIKLLSVDDILGAPDLKEEYVDVPEWGGRVKIRGLKLGKRQELRRKATTNGEIDPDKLEVLMFIACVAEPQFSPEHFDQLAQKSSEAMDRVLKRIIVLTGMAPEQIKENERSFR